MSDAPKRFPVLLPPDERRRFPDCPSAVPWEWVAPHEAQARRNHCDQSLSELAARGGLDPLELYAVIHDAKYHVAHRGEMREQKLPRMIEWLKATVAMEPQQ